MGGVCATRPERDVGIFNLIKRIVSRKSAEQAEASDTVHDLDSSESYRLHREIIDSKPLLKEIYEFYFRELTRELEPTSGKRILEIGAGAYGLGDFTEGVITSNSAYNDYIDVVVDAQHMPFADSSLDGVVMLNTMHHIPKPKLFFTEVARVLKPGGVMSMVEPFFSPPAGFIYKNIHHEPVLETEPGSWEIPEGLTANQKIPYHIFVRDRERFESDNPALRVERVEPHTCITHLVSGGLSYRSLAPASFGPLVWGMERLLKPFRGVLAMCMTVVVRKAA